MVMNYQDSHKQASSERVEEENKKITLFASIRQSSHVTKFNYRYHTGAIFDFKYGSNGYNASSRGAAFAAAIRGITKFQQLVHYCRKQ